MSIRILKNGYKTRLIKDAYVFHKRRTSFRQFFKQVHNSGIARINLYKLHPQSLKLVHAIPAAYVFSFVALIIFSVLISTFFILPILLHWLLLFADASIKNKSLYIGLLATATGMIQLIGYGSGFIGAFWKRVLFGKKEYSAFNKNFYK